MFGATGCALSRPRFSPVAAMDTNVISNLFFFFCY